MQRIDLDIGNRPCPVLISHDTDAALRLLLEDGAHQVAVIGDDRVMGLYGEGVIHELQADGRQVLGLSFPAGEINKVRKTKERLEDQLLTAGFDRHGCLVALGGGITLDLVGFVAATYLRGVAHINVPTSLLAQVDAAIGGKTGVNTAHGKNLVGAFHQPIGVAINGQHLQTLPVAEWQNGLAEIVKHAVIADDELFAWLEAHSDTLRAPGVIDDFPLRRCVEIKGRIVQQDERERGLRSLLNFGHTVGHAIERASAFAIPHGLAVALGMVVEGELACAVAGFPRRHQERLRALLLALQVPICHSELAFSALEGSFAADKKRRHGMLHVALPQCIGQVAHSEGRYTVEVTAAQIAAAWEQAA